MPPATNSKLSDQNVVFDRHLIDRYNVSGPRYTSYPTALQFGELSSLELLRQISVSPFVDRDMSLYVHLPFCATLCYYCACNKVVTRKREPLQEYLDLLRREIDLIAPHFGNRFVSQLHWGGGTPTFLEDDEVTALMHLLRENFQFRDDSEGEFSIEIDPRTVDANRIQHLRSAGFNRLSLGIQDFNPDVQKAVNRVQSFELTRDVLSAARRSGFRSVSVDLIYGLPKQTEATFSTTLNQVVELRPNRISNYNYAHLPERFTPQKRIQASDLPAPEEKLDILGLCIEKLTAEGYVYIGMDHFALPDDELAVAQREGTLQRNFQGYSTYADCDLLALGVTGISQIGNSYSQNAKDLESYRQHLQRDQLPVERGVLIDAEDQLRKAVIKTLICEFSLDFTSIESAFNINFADHFSSELTALKRMAVDGLLTIHDGRIRVTQRGRLFIRNICMVFDRYIQAATMDKKFSKAI